MWNILEDLEPLLETSNMVLSLTKKNDLVTISILPKTKNDKDLNMKPFTMTATMQELQEGGSAEFAKGISKVGGILTNLAEFEESAEKALEKKTPAASTASTTAKTTTAAPAKKEAEKKIEYTPVQKQAIKDIEKGVANAKDKYANDPEKWNFVHRELIKKADTHQLPVYKKMIEDDLPLKENGDLFATQEVAAKKTEAPAKETAAPAKKETPAKAPAKKAAAKVNEPPAKKAVPVEPPPVIEEEVTIDESEEQIEDDAENVDTELQTEDDASQEAPELEQKDTPASEEDWL
jgi:PRTRC genetic system protein E